ncbi:MAG TPA: SGNH hydrolase domain-containing protein [Pedococcus sp.]|nr:SGNH hydrolase domain-containing protein [Pedococcus sp.]
MTRCRGLAFLVALVLLAGCQGARSSRRSVTDARTGPRPSTRSEAARRVRVDSQHRLAARQRARFLLDAALFAREDRAGIGPCFGAPALTTPPALCDAATKSSVRPPLSRAALDKSDAYPSVSGQPTCFSYPPEFPEVTCHRGARGGRFRVALVGNSHAGQWLPALEFVARHRDWQITTYLASNCAMSQTPQNFRPLAVSTACSQWVADTTARIASGGFDLVLLSDKLSITATGHDLAASQAPYEWGYVTILRAWQRAHLTVVALRDTPSPWPEDVPRCLVSHPRRACAGRRATWLRPDPVLAAVRDVHDPHIAGADLTSYFCPTTACPAVIGGVVVYFDESHLTATYDRTLASPLEAVLGRAVHRG